LLGFVPRLQTNRGQVKLPVNLGLPPVGIGGNQMDGEMAPNRVDRAGQTREKLAIHRQGAIDIAYQVFQSEMRLPGDV
jgi:hypothetical protein